MVSRFFSRQTGVSRLPQEPATGLTPGPVTTEDNTPAIGDTPHARSLACTCTVHDSTHTYAWRGARGWWWVLESTQLFLSGQGRRGAALRTGRKADQPGSGERDVTSNSCRVWQVIMPTSDTLHKVNVISQHQLWPTQLETS